MKTSVIISKESKEPAVAIAPSDIQGALNALSNELPKGANINTISKRPELLKQDCFCKERCSGPCTAYYLILDTHKLFNSGHP